jgi:hypothetical protein
VRLEIESPSPSGLTLGRPFVGTHPKLCGMRKLGTQSFARIPGQQIANPS